jgi:hypothetical protein
MSDFFEIDFLDIDSNRSGDAISIRYQLDHKTYIQVVDGGFQDTGEKITDHINTYYNDPDFIDSVVVSHPDGDHAGGLRKVLEEFKIGELWMLRPWIFADELIDRFSRFTSVENLIKRLKEIYPNIATLEELANAKNIPIYEPFQGEEVGAFVAMAPARERYLDMIIESEKTPEATKEEQTLAASAVDMFLEKAAAKVVTLIRAIWGAETFSPNETSPENEMSIIQYANLCGNRILLTGDAGRAGLMEAANYAPYVGLELPGIDRFQVPHHGSRRNVSTEILDCWLGPRLESKHAEGEKKFTAIISAAKKDKDHPRNAVIRAVIHRGAKAVTTQGKNLRTHHNAPKREGWSSAKPVPYPEQQEE